MLAQCVRIEMLGGLRIQHARHTIDRFNTHKTGLLLAYLAYHRRTSHPREVLVEMLWPESEQETGRISLRVALNSLRHQLEPPGVRAGSVLFTDRAGVRLNPDAFQTDVELFGAELRAAARAQTAREQIRHLDQAVQLYRGELLPGYYDEWVISERRHLEDVCFQALLQLAAILEKEGESSRALDYARRAVSMNPLHEETQRLLIRLYAQTGQLAEAQQQYREFVQLLREEIGEQPAPETRSLAEKWRLDTALSGKPSRRRVSTRPARSPLNPPASGGKLAPSPPAGRAGVGFPPEPAAHLPLPLTRFFGREEEMARLQAMLDREGRRLVTLTGPGGSGKSRLAIEFARSIAGPRENAVWFVPLADITDAAQIIEEIVKALGVPLSLNASPLEQAIAILSRRPSLLILDNFERLAESGSMTVRLLLDRVPTLACLITSRQRLDLMGEQEYPVRPLPTPRRPGTPERLLEFASVQLYTDRAQLTRPDFQVTPRNASDVAALCDRLEGLPLAIELAAGWAQTLTPGRMVQQMERRFDLLVSRKPDLTPRHRSLGAAMDWSYDLLAPEFQRLFARLSVFRGGWTLEAAEAVCEQARAAGALSLLQAHSLLRSEEGENGMRFGMLETVREYAARRLRAEEQSHFARRHAEFFLQRTEEADQHIPGVDQALWLAELEEEHDNLRAALAWSLADANAPAVGLRLAAALWFFWYVRGYAREGRAWLETALSQTNGDGGKARAKALNGAGFLACAQGDYANARTFLDQALALWRSLGDSRGTAASLGNLATVLCSQGEFAQARLAYEESLALAREQGDSMTVANALGNLGAIAIYQEDYAAASGYLEEVLALYRKMEDRWSVALALHNLGEVAGKQGNLADARALLVESLTELWALGDKSTIAMSLTSLGVVAVQQGEWDRAVRLFGAAAALREALGTPLSPAEQTEFEENLAAAREQLGGDDFAAAWTDGRAMTPEQAVPYASDDGRGHARLQSPR